MLENIEVLNKLKEEKTLNEISSELNIPISEVYKKVKSLKNDGWLLRKVIYDDGNINYYFKKFPEFMKTNTIDLRVKNHYSLSAMLISDTHYGNSLSCMNYLDMVYDYCKECNIHIIINAGDLVDGSFNREKQEISDPLKQLEYTIKNYPFDDSILNLICLGNHDFSLFKSGIDIKKALESARSDLIPLGYGLGIINTENDQLFVRHNIPDYSFEPINGKMVLEGHKHKMAFTDDASGFLVNIPTLSNLTLGKHKYPGALRMNLFFDNDGYINSGSFEQFIFNDKMYTVNETLINFDLDHERFYEKDVKPKLRVKKYDSNGLNQVEKFNKKWGRN